MTNEPLRPFTVVDLATNKVIGTVEAPNHWEALGPALKMAREAGATSWCYKNKMGSVMGGEVAL
jgi:hypothetical protein